MELKAGAGPADQALSDAFQQHYEDLHRLLTRKLGCPSLAADTVHDLWVKLRVDLSARDVHNPRAYLFRMASNLATDRIRKERARARIIGPSSAQDDIASDQPGADIRLDYHQRLAILRRAIDELPPRCRDVFLLHKFGGLTHLEIAGRLGLARSTVEQHIIRALAHCRARLKQELE